MVEKGRLTVRFHNPNTVEDTAKALLKLFVEVNGEKADEAVRQAAERGWEPGLRLPPDKPSATASGE